METLKCDERIKNRSHSGRKSRALGKIPGILYSPELGNLLFEVGELEFNREILKHGEHAALNLKLNNKEHMALIKDIQKEPVTQKVLHIDLQEINSEKVIEAEVPILFVGEDLVGKNGGAIQKEKSSVKIQGKYHQIPKIINVDVSKMLKGNVLKIADLEMAKEIAFLDDLNTVLAVVSRTGTKTFDEEENKNDSNMNEEPPKDKK